MASNVFVEWEITTDQREMGNYKTSARNFKTVKNSKIMWLMGSVKF